MSKRDCYLGTLAGFLIGIFILPILKAAKPEFYSSKIALSLIIFFTIAVPLGLLIAYYIAKKIPLVWQLAKFVVTGGFNFLLDLGVLTILTFVFRDYFFIQAKETILSLGFIVITFYSIYKAFSFIVANINSYYWNKYWTFEKKSNEKSSKEFFQFFTVSIIGFLVNVFVASFVFKSINPIGITSDQWGLIGAAFGSIAGLAWNFIGYKFIVFKK
jgi:putative flippase GtrA